MSSIIPKNVGLSTVLGTALAGGYSFGVIFPIMTQALGYSSRNAYVNSVALSYALGRYYWGNLSNIKPSCVVAGIPLPSVNELSHGISDREVRYRANGGVFLAHQSGGNESLRIIGKAWGDNRFLFLNMLDLLFLWGSSTITDIFAQAKTSFLSGSAKILQLQNVPDMLNPRFTDLTKDPWEEFNLNNLDEGYAEQHMTFPVITKNRVYISMYIETYSWRQRIDEEGRKMVEYTIFFRKYEPIPEYEFASVQIPKKDGSLEYRAVYKEISIDRPRVYASWKAAAEILTTMSINTEMFELSNITKFGQQFMLNYYGVEDEKNKIPGIISERFF